MLTLTFLGVGSAFAKRNLHSNALIEAWKAGRQEHAPDDNMLIDFGATGPAALHQLKEKDGFEYLSRNGMINYPAIRRVFVTHLHADHIGGLEELALMNRYTFADPASGEGRKSQLLTSEELAEALWEHSLKGGLGALPQRPATLADYFSVQTLHPPGLGKPDALTMCSRYEISMFRTDHVQIREKHDWPSYGLIMRDKLDGGTAVFSGDTRFDPTLFDKVMAKAGMIFHDVQLEDHHGAIHAPLPRLRTLPAKVRSKIVLYHYGDDWDDGKYDFVQSEFAGFARPMRRYVLFNYCEP